MKQKLVTDFIRKKVLVWAIHLPPITFIIYLQRIMQIKTILTLGLSILGLKFNNLEFVDIIDLLEKNLAKLQESLELITLEAMCYNLTINIGKTKIMVLETMPQLHHSKEKNEEIETVNQFINGSLITSDNDCSAEIRRRIGIASGALHNLRKINTFELRYHRRLLNVKWFHYSRSISDCIYWVAFIGTVFIGTKFALSPNEHRSSEGRP